jgi:HD-like signal output (HDOD) protein
VGWGAATLRAAAARLLRAALIYGEDEVLPQLPTVMLALREAVADEDAGMQPSAGLFVAVVLSLENLES